MAVTAAWYGNALINAFGSGTSGNVPNCDFLSDNIPCTLHSSAYTFNQDTHIFVSSLTNELTTANGYTAGGINLASKTLAYATRVSTFDANDVAWTSSTLTARYAILSDRTPTAAASQQLLLYVNFGADVSTTNGTFTVQWNASGIMTITAAVEA